MDFFSLSYFKELKVLLILELLMLLDLAVLFYANNFTPEFSLPAFLISLGIWGISCLLEPRKYFNLATLIGTGFIMYIVFWFMFSMIR